MSEQTSTPTEPSIELFVFIGQDNAWNKPFVIDIDAGPPDVDRSTLTGRYSKTTMEQMKTQYGDVQVMTAAEWQVVHENAWRTPPTPTTEEWWDYALGILPPEDWQTTGSNSSFKMSEHMSGRMTTIYARVDGRYWSFTDLDNLPHATIVEMCRKAAAKEQETTCSPT